MDGRQESMGKEAAYHVFCVGADRRVAEIAYRVINPYFLKHWSVYISAAPLIDAPDSVNTRIYLWLYRFYIANKNGNKTKRRSVYTIPRLLLPLVSRRRSMQPRLSLIQQRASRRS